MAAPSNHQQIPAFDQSGSSPPRPIADIVAKDHGSICIVRGMTDAGYAWIEKNCCGDGYQPFGLGARLVEPRYVFAILKGAIDDGLVVA
jgi:hypothetical protein